MTRLPGTSRQGRSSGPRIGEGVPFAAIASIVGLVVVAALTVSISSGQLPFLNGSTGGKPGASGDPGPAAQTPTPSNVIVVPTEKPGFDVPGAFVYVKDGNIWIQSAGAAAQLTTGGTDSMPSFTPDGSAVLFVRTRTATGYWPVNGVTKRYRLEVPSLMRVALSGGDAQQLLDGLVDPAGKLKWSGFIREPVLSPDGRTVAMASDLPDPSTSDVTLRLFDLKTKKLKNPGLAQVIPLGHQDPAWRPDGLRLAYVRSNRDGAKGAPQIYGYSTETGKAAPITGPGYLHPSWSPDGRYLAATRTSAFGTDIVLLNAKTGAEVLRVTDDGESWAPVWSPRGDQVAFLHVVGQIVDLRLAQLDGRAGSWSVKETVNLTSNAGLDGASRPGWFISAADLPASPAPTQAPAASSIAP